MRAFLIVVVARAVSFCQQRLPQSLAQPLSAEHLLSALLLLACLYIICPSMQRLFARSRRANHINTADGNGNIDHKLIMDSAHADSEEAASASETCSTCDGSLSCAISLLGVAASADDPAAAYPPAAVDHVQLAPATGATSMSNSSAVKSSLKGILHMTVEARGVPVFPAKAASHKASPGTDLGPITSTTSPFKPAASGPELDQLSSPGSVLLHQPSPAVSGLLQHQGPLPTSGPLLPVAAAAESTAHGDAQSQVLLMRSQSSVDASSLQGVLPAAAFQQFDRTTCLTASLEDAEGVVALDPAACSTPAAPFPTIYVTTITSMPKASISTTPAATTPTTTPPTVSSLAAAGPNPDGLNPASNMANPPRSPASALPDTRAWERAPTSISRTTATSRVVYKPTAAATSHPTTPTATLAQVAGLVTSSRVSFSHANDVASPVTVVPATADSSASPQLHYFGGRGRSRIVLASHPALGSPTAPTELHDDAAAAAASSSMQQKSFQPCSPAAASSDCYPESVAQSSRRHVVRGNVHKAGQQRSLQRARPAVEGVAEDPQTVPQDPPASGADQNARQLTGRLSACVDMSLLVQLVQQYGGSSNSVFNHIHAATALLKAAHLLKENRATARQFQAVGIVARSYVGQMDARGLSNSLWALVASGCTDDAQLLAALLHHVRRSITTFNGQSLASTAWSLSCLPEGCHDVELLSCLITQAHAKLQSFDARSLAGLLFALAKLKQSCAVLPSGLPALSTAILAASRLSIGDFNAQGLANTAWAMAILEHQDAAFTDLLLAASRTSLQSWYAHQLATLLYALAKQKQDGAPSPACLGELLPEVLAVASKRLGAFGPQDISNVAWALATLEHPDISFLSALLAFAVPKLRDFTAQGLSNTCWAMAVMHHCDTAFLDACLARSRQLLHIFAPQNLAKMAWSLAKLDHHDEPFMELLLARSRQTCQDFNSQDLSNLLYALARLQHPMTDHGRLVEAALARARQLLPNFLPQHLANMACSLAKLGHYDCGFMGQLLAASRLRLPQFQHQDLSNVAWALAQLRHHDPAFLTSLLAAMTPKLQGFINQELANVMWAMASLHHQDRQTVHELLREVSCRLHSLNDQDIANVMWALAVLDHDAAAHVHPLLLKAQQHYRHMSGEHLCQVFQYLVTMEEAGHISRSVQGGAQYRQLRGSCLQAWLDGMVSRPSHTQLNVLHAIRSLPGCESAGSETLTADGLFSMDITLQIPGGARVAIEVDGPHHFMANAGWVVNGATALRNRMLAARGWHVVSVPTSWWKGASRCAPGGGGPLLLQLLHQCGVCLVPMPMPMPSHVPAC